MPEKTYHLYLIRHGESIQNTHENMDGLPDHAIPLTEKGKEQAREAGAFLENFLEDRGVESVRLWVSPYKRTRQTADEIMSAFEEKAYTRPHHWCTYAALCERREDDMLAELQFGLFNNIPKEEVPNIYPTEWAWFQNERSHKGKFFARRPGGESPFDCAIRQKLFLDTLYRDFEDEDCPKHLIIVGHGAALNVLRKCIFHYSYEWYEKELNPGNCSIQHISLRPGSGNNRDLGYIYGEPMPEK